MLALIPFGFSMFILIPFFSRGTGNSFDGNDDNQSLYL